MTDDLFFLVFVIIFVFRMMMRVILRSRSYNISTMVSGPNNTNRSGTTTTSFVTWIRCVSVSTVVMRRRIGKSWIGM